MADLFCNHCIFVFILLAFASAKEYTKGNLGECDLNLCNSGCAAKGYCDSSSTPPSCKCYFESTKSQSASDKTCNVGIGPCSLACDEQCCNSTCADKFPGDQQGWGYCQVAGPPYLRGCVCTYNC